ncbi:MAG: UDP-N-acetylglucosamine--N-acetylmuramyl-(pentapeptide) pyrophosphoryl-undecaprenol N-acetylglucosamine transferase [Clostridia bacterium]|nr:UDP-N-acetylglucosamine--N-acetylmuramyl-(pentapeptide) pyrophosphoryl-undecaprenol N-acetylglucosamine transferase [Clostridia bacterium]
MQNVIITGGGTAGHITPLLALLPFLTTRFKVHYIGQNEGMEKELLKSENVVYHGLDCPKLTRGKIFANLLVPFKLFSAVRKAKKLIKEIKPIAIFSKGGFVSLPASLASGDVPLVLHESDTSLGLANRIALSHANALCSSFPIENRFKGEYYHTGSPLRSRIYSGNRGEGLKTCGFSGRKKVLLVMGGSLGAKAINDLVDDELNELTKRYDVIHIRGKGNGADRKNGYYPIEFTEKIYDLFACADLAVTRGGGNAIFELGAVGVPMLIIPLPKGASRGDQVENAKQFEKNGLALVADKN